ncbi:MAG: LuxR C-terminal-related transcriptional regulator [Tenuifilaceae bacterium]
MVNQQEVNEDFRNFCKQMDFDLNLKNYKDELIDWSKLENFIVLRNQFFYVNDFVNATNVFVHPNLVRITGYSAEEFHSFGRIYELIHPDDSKFVLDFSLRTVSLGKYYKEELLKDPFKALFSIDFRFKHKEGHYIKLNRQTTCLRTDREGNVVYALVVFTDITHSKKNDSYNIHWLGDTKFILHFDDLIKKYKKDYNITKREKDVLNMLVNGESATDIAARLCLSVHTVISHRKNLLQKTGTKNTAELVKFALERNII